MTHTLSARDPFWYSDLRWPRLWVIIGLLLVVAVTVASLIRVSGPIEQLMSRDKLIHFSVYLLLCLWFLQIFRRLPAQLLVALALFALGGAIEIFQGFMPYRYLDLYDMVANTAGIVAALVLARIGVNQLLRRVERLFG